MAIRLAFRPPRRTQKSRPRRRRACLGLDFFVFGGDTAARRRRNTPGGSPAQGASAPQPASRPEGEGRAGQGERARGEGAPGRPSSSRGKNRGSAGKTSHTKPIFCMTYLPYKIWVLYDWIAARRGRKGGQGGAAERRAPPTRRPRKPRGEQPGTMPSAHPSAGQVRSGDRVGCSRGDFVTVGLRPPVVHALPRIALRFPRNGL